MVAWGGDDLIDARDGVAGNDSVDGGAHILGDTAYLDLGGERRVVGIEVIWFG